ncbi:MAG: SDR family NAD(P)-dependent oxidoreductase, partial [Leptolyngbyaceae cyanobacterium SM2_3_12]|nr:SDR family NAD(P)-dependent oxidoreductase [Leptolyngbyaceae cyanobacterium SM2_3_12]
MLTSLTHQTVLITGASSGIGASCARFFAQAGARLILAARRQEKLEFLVTDLQQHCSVETLTLALDVQQPDAVAKALENLPVDWQAIDVLINNAGLSRG